MRAGFSVEVKGKEALFARLRRLGHRVEENVLRQGMRKAMNVVKEDVVPPKRTGALARDLQVRISIRYANVTGRFGTQAGKQYRMERQLFGSWKALRKDAVAVSKTVVKEPDKYGFIVEMRKPFMGPKFKSKKGAMEQVFFAALKLAVEDREN